MSRTLLDKLMAKDGDITMRMKKDINVQVGDQIKAARERARLTQEQFAERIDVSPQFVSDLERGVVGISLATLKRTCSVLGVSSDQILFGKETEERAVLLAERCKGLSDEQFAAMVEIVRKCCELVGN